MEALASGDMDGHGVGFGLEALDRMAEPQIDGGVLAHRGEQGGMQIGAVDDEEGTAEARFRLPRPSARR